MLPPTEVPMRKVTKTAYSKCSAAAMCLAFAWAAPPSVSQDPGPVVTTMQELVAMFGEASQSMADFRDLIGRQRSGEATGLDRDTAVSMRDTLFPLSADLQNLFVSQKVTLFAHIDMYVDCVGAGTCNAEDEWEQVRSAMENILVRVNKVLGDVRRENSDFVLETTHLELMVTLQTRVVTLQKLIDLPAPTTEAELALLTELRAHYVTLVEALAESIEELNAYIKSIGPPGIDGLAT